MDKFLCIIPSPVPILEMHIFVDKFVISWNLKSYTKHLKVDHQIFE